MRFGRLFDTLGPMLRPLMRPRAVVMFCLWVLPALIYLGIGIVALYQTGWLTTVFWTLPVVWLVAWLVSRFWKPPQATQTAARQPLQAPTFWTPRDTAAISVVETFRASIHDVDRREIANPQRYIDDAWTLAEKLASHYQTHQGDNQTNASSNTGDCSAADNPTHASQHALQAVTLTEILAVVHLAAEDVETWVIENIPGSNLATIGHLQQLPRVSQAADAGQMVGYLVAAASYPAKLLAYPLWRKSNGVVIELQNELARAFYQRFLRQVGYYLIEMYSGRLKGGAEQYRDRFGYFASAVHRVKGDMGQLSELQSTSTTIAVIGQVKAGKSSLINLLIGEKVATTSILPETRQVKRHQFSLPNSDQVVTLLDTPGYDEANVSEAQQLDLRTAALAADIVLLVLAANVSAREADLEVIRQMVNHYQTKMHLKPPVVIAVITHIDSLRPVREWEPPYDWRNPSMEKERSIAAAVQYTKELFGDSITAFACVYTGDADPTDTSVTDELLPQLIEHSGSGQSAAILKAFYQQLDQQRRGQLLRQVKSLIGSLAR